MSTSPALIRETFPRRPLAVQLHHHWRSADQEGHRRRSGRRPRTDPAAPRPPRPAGGQHHPYPRAPGSLPASGEMKKRTGASLHLHKDDQFLWDNLEMQCQLFGVPYTPVPAPDRWLADDEGTGLRLRSGTAHAGAYAGLDEFLVPRAKLLIAGDTLFRRGIGRTDLWAAATRRRSSVRSGSVCTASTRTPRWSPAMARIPRWAKRCARTPSSGAEKDFS